MSTSATKVPRTDGENKWLGTYIPIIVIAAAFIGSLFVIASARREEAPPGTTATIRIGHWQLEGGVRDGIDAMIAEYTNLHPNVHVVQDAIPEGTYSTWLTTQLMGGTAPDLLEIGMVARPILLGYLKRYFLPLTELAASPNPYNKGTDLEDTPWSATFRDGMRSGYYEEMAEFMAAPLSQFGTSLFYNKSLLRELTGLEECPSDLEGFLAACKKIREQKDKDGRPYIPIAGSNYHWGMWDQYLFDPATFSAVYDCDFNRDGAVGVDELFLGVRNGLIDLDHPGLRAKFGIIDDVVANFQPGFTGLGRDEAVFLFVQGRAVFITTGTWDAGGLVEQARDLMDSNGNPVELGVSSFPHPTRDDPKYGDAYIGPVYEMPFVGFPFGVTRCSKHPEVAMDFLQFLGSKAGNTQMNGKIGWIPSVIDTPMPPLLAKFMPNLQGIYGAMPLNLGGDTVVKWTQLYDLYKVGQISFDDFMKQYRPYYLEHGEEELEEILRNNRRSQPGDEQMAARYLAEAIRASACAADSGNAGDATEIGTPAEKEATAWASYRTYSSNTLVSRPLGESFIYRALRTGKCGRPYELSDLAKQRVRARAANAGAAKEEN